MKKKLFVIIISNLEIAQIIFIFWQNQMMVALAIRSNKYKMLGIMWHPERGELDLIDQNLIKDFYQ